ncbi:hypothetical protein SBV1_270050 [Verrucomicrobia bacterium]|nr:hypothetical protein SBV1_270050 [Verrucomicrobiota bacterium]
MGGRDRTCRRADRDWTSIAFPGIINEGGSTWAAVGDESPLYVPVVLVPEPSTLALAGLGAAASCISRRRKRGGVA